MTEGNWERLDALDHKIVDKLARDARISNRAIAAELGVTEGTIRTRIKRLQNEGLIQFTVVTDFRMAGSPNLCMLGIDADPSRVVELAERLRQLPELSCVILMLGRFNLLAMGLFTNIEQLNELITEQIRSLPGVQKVQTAISVHNLKYEPGVAKITYLDAAAQED
ncbi:Lrp/AsnC family transcriptional regulator [Sphingobium sp. CAP-1]|uniref:Lrp/AsnC family transcriptional regulator n=1 Tax=Sphingobium sp. CAP-1 TaxID=2676077 RepID=UPI0012BB3D7A|nr:Lrp/AsnC family transcriptional regulator [Sphingobium sp. CAP-1]QGP80586.1 AsnC family transcriptional regulator [Sphingobium sp. CAP-1]